MYQDKGNKPELKQLCIECGGSNLIERTKEQSFPYGPPGDQVILTAAMPVITCENCGYEYFDERGESARHIAVCRHLGVQTPEEVRKVREGTCVTRDPVPSIDWFRVRFASAVGGGRRCS